MDNPLEHAAAVLAAAFVSRSMGVPDAEAAAERYFECLDRLVDAKKSREETKRIKARNKPSEQGQRS